MITVLLFLTLFSLLFSMMVEDYFLSVDFSRRTQAFYEAKCLYHLFLLEVKSGRILSPAGELRYSCGVLNYQWDGQRWEVEVDVSTKHYVFYQEEVTYRYKNGL